MNPFESIAPSEESKVQMQGITDLCDNLYQVLNLLKPSRERSIAITKLEEVSMWAKKSIVFNQE